MSAIRTIMQIASRCSSKTRSLQLDDDLIDVVIGEVKQGPAELNVATKDHAVLHSMLRRIEWFYEGSLLSIIEGLQANHVHVAAGRGGGDVRTRLVAFGRSDVNDLTTISHSHIIKTLLKALRGARRRVSGLSSSREPAPAFLRLLLKSGFDITK